jgi:hypothetical protein
LIAVSGLERSMAFEALREIDGVEVPCGREVLLQSQTGLRHVCSILLECAQAISAVTDLI